MLGLISTPGGLVKLYLTRVPITLGIVPRANQVVPPSEEYSKLLGLEVIV
jgi:hypothetical protein